MNDPEYYLGYHLAFRQGLYQVYANDKHVGEYTSEFQAKNAIKERRKSRARYGMSPIG